ncbi:RNA polymerase sigma factor [Microlunatus antarcticus]|uniref:RNA polymerase sigma-70 factor (ECF subfamily) n=1 Tax=Microlunatus antarcticus TaxID=53388 RepID=A0A7W5JSB5_9ACTN|nr:sigma-70 family RNA polymerase sigma factor [Microlunatus antarcticus]MBB3325454.1 RNA polymerase sigma-70 factor (ECF subfamily) [Microlunatus antarcticus]
MDPDEDVDALVRAAQAGDAEALNELLVRLQPLVLHRCSRFLPHRMDAEEAAQDALLMISRHLRDFGGRGSFRGWVTVIASNCARGTYRSMRRHSEVVGAAPLLESADPQTTSVIAGTRLDLLETLDALGAAYPDLVDPFVLRDLGELTYDEIAAILNLPLSTVKDRIHRARTFVRGRLRPSAEHR